MKRIAFIGIALCILMIGCASQPKVLPTDQLIAQRIIEVDKTKDQLFTTSMDWMARSFTSSKNVIEYQDRVGGIIVGNGWVMVPYGMGIPLKTKFQITINIKDQKAKISFERVMVETRMGSQTSDNPVNNEYSWTKCFLPEANKIFDKYEAFIKVNDEW